MTSEQVVQMLEDSFSRAGLPPFKPGYEDDDLVFGTIGNLKVEILFDGEIHWENPVTGDRGEMVLGQSFTDELLAQF